MFRNGILIATFVTMLSGQPPQQPNPRQVDAVTRETQFLRYFFTLIGNPDTKPEVLKLHRSLVVTQYRLDSVQAQALEAAVPQYQAALGSLRSAIVTIKQTPGRPSTDEGRQSLAQLADTFDKSLNQIAQQLRQQLGAEASARVLPPAEQLP